MAALNVCFGLRKPYYIRLNQALDRRSSFHRNCNKALVVSCPTCLSCRSRFSTCVQSHVPRGKEKMGRRT